MSEQLSLPYSVYSDIVCEPQPFGISSSLFKEELREGFVCSLINLGSLSRSSCRSAGINQLRRTRAGTGR